ncbi:MAG: hypothetical protein B6D65_00490 [candidate division Zixibacteria bacterium 4484_93]|nr:MAG: hypothetical protein B6D65_00490 [candidate division Zixibacteria bacterium 4484_93]
MKKPLILVVDDQQINIDLLKRIVISLGYNVITSTNGEDALKKVELHSPDLVMLDIMMPGMDGYKVAEKLKGDEKTRRIPIVFITGLKDLENNIRAFEIGADDFFTKPFNMKLLGVRIRSLLKQKMLNDKLVGMEKVLVTLARTVEAKDPYTHGHSERVGRIAGKIAVRMKLTKDEINLLSWAADLHDIGKIGISDTILHKPGRLEPAEWKLIRKHPIIGRQICESLPSPGELLDVIESHHEHLDGSGYPNGKSGDDISLYTRIISVSDVYDALTTDRPYRKRYTPSEAIQILEEETRKGWWDKDVLELLRVVIQ